MMDDIKTPNNDQEVKPPTVSSRVSIPISQPKVEAPTMNKSSAPIIEPLNKEPSVESAPAEVKSEVTEKAMEQTPAQNAPVELSALDVPADNIDQKNQPAPAEVKSEVTEEVQDPVLPDVKHEEPKTETKLDTVADTTTNLEADKKTEEPEKVEYKDGFISDETPLPETPEQTSGDDQKVSEKPLEINTDSGSSSSTSTSPAPAPIMTPVTTEPVNKIDDVQSPKIETKTGGIPTVEVPEMEDKDVKGKVIPASVEHKKRKVNVMAIVVAIVLALALAGGAGYAYLQNSKQNKTTNVTPTPTKKVEPVKVTPLSSKDIDKTNEAVDTSLKELDSTNDIMTTDLSDTGLGLL